MTNGAAFKKGQEVTYICSWDNKGTVYFQHAVVYSCGKKQMVLTDAVSGVEMGRHYAPEVGDVATVSGFNWGATFPRLTDAEAEVLCLQLGARIVEINREQYTVRADGTWGQKDKGYRAAMLKDIAELHEPRAMHRQE